MMTDAQHSKVDEKDKTKYSIKTTYRLKLFEKINQFQMACTMKQNLTLREINKKIEILPTHTFFFNTAIPYSERDS